MTETQATSGSASAEAAHPAAHGAREADGAAAFGGAMDAGVSSSEAGAHAGDGYAGDGYDSGPGGGPAGGAHGGADAGAVGRASVPGDRSGGSPKFVRAPGMVPPPESLTVPVQSPPSATGTASVTTRPTPGGLPVGGVPVSVAPVSAVPVHAAPVSGLPSSGGPATGTASVPTVARAAVRTSAAPGLGQRPGQPGVGGPGGMGGPGVMGGPGGPGGMGGATGSARVTEAVRAARKTVTAAVSRGPRRARLHVKRIDPWSVMKFAFAVSFVLFVVVIVATSVLYLALDAMDVFKSVNKTLSDMIGATGGESGSSFKITAKGVIGGAALLGLVNVVLFTALATLGAFIYNVCADLVGGIEVTLAEKD